ncbi:MAG: glycosyltransferase [Bacteroidia bacterium]|nr:glycosyltransferase [Bacteroidia bacterium]
MITKWYPHLKDPQFGVFIRKQALAISRYREMVVYYAHADPDAESKFNLETIVTESLTEYRMYYRKSSSFGSTLINAIRYLEAWRKSRKVIWKNHGKPGILHAYILLRPAILAYCISIIYRIPFVISEQWSGYTNGKFLERPFFVRHLSKVVFRKAKARIAVSQFLRSAMIKLGFKEPIDVIPNVIEFQRPNEIHNSDSIRVLVVADLVDEIKNISGILYAMEIVTQEIPNLHLKIIGHGKDEKMLHQLSKELNLFPEKVSFLGLKSNEEVYDALWDCDFLVMNSRFETFSLICAEAFSCGKPVVATRCGGPEEFINEKNGILIPVDDINALSQAIVRMVKEVNTYDSEAISRDAFSKFSSDHIGEQLNLLYRDLL